MRPTGGRTAGRFGLRACHCGPVVQEMRCCNACEQYPQAVSVPQMPAVRRNHENREMTMKFRQARKIYYARNRPSRRDTYDRALRTMFHACRRQKNQVPSLFLNQLTENAGNACAMPSQVVRSESTKHDYFSTRIVARQMAFLPPGTDMVFFKGKLQTCNIQP